MSYNGQGIEMVDYHCDQCGVFFSIESSSAQGLLHCPYHGSPDNVRNLEEE